MSYDLKEYTEILDAAEDPEAEAEAIRIAIQALMFHQVVYDDTHSLPKAAIQALKDHRAFFEKYFGVAGFAMTYDLRSQMIAISPALSETPPYGLRQTRLKKDETLIRLVLRYLFDEGFVNGKMDETGRVETNTLELLENYEKMGKAPPMNESNLVDNILRDLSRKGAVRIGERDPESKVTMLTILPGIRILVPDSFVDQIIEMGGANA